MKKFIESKFGLAGFFLLLNVIAFLIPGFVGRVIVLTGAFIFQFILAGNDKHLEWNFYNSFSYNYSNRSLIFRNLLFSLTSWLTMINFIYCSLVFNPEIKSISFLLILLFSISSLSLMLLHYLKSLSYIRLRGLLMAPVLVGIIFSLVLNFGTQFIWLPIFLFFVISILSAFEELSDTFSKKKNSHVINRAFIFLIILGLISTTIQFWSVIYSYLIFSILGISLWVIALIVVGLILLFICIKWTEKQYQQLKLEIEAEEKLKAEEEKIEKRVADLSTDNYDPIGISIDNVVFIAKRYNLNLLPYNFNFKKVLDFNLVCFTNFSEIKKQLVYSDSLVEVLKMYNNLFKKNYNDNFLKKIKDNYILLCDFTDHHKHHLGSASLKKKIKENCSNLPDYPWTF